MNGTSIPFEHAHVIPPTSINIQEYIRESLILIDGNYSGRVRKYRLAVPMTTFFRLYISLREIVNNERSGENWFEAEGIEFFIYSGECQIRGQNRKIEYCNICSDDLTNTNCICVQAAYPDGQVRLMSIHKNCLSELSQVKRYLFEDRIEIVTESAYSD